MGCPIPFQYTMLRYVCRESVEQEADCRRYLRALNLPKQPPRRPTTCLHTYRRRRYTQHHQHRPLQQRIRTASLPYQKPLGTNLPTTTNHFLNEWLYRVHRTMRLPPCRTALRTTHLPQTNQATTVPATPHHQLSQSSRANWPTGTLSEQCRLYRALR